MDITNPIILWKDYDVNELPLNVSALSDKVCGNKHIKEFYFDGFATVDGRVRAFLYVAENKDAKGVILYLGNGTHLDNTAVDKFYDLGYTVAALDYLGATEDYARFTLYPKSLSFCNCRGKEKFDAPDDALSSCWYIWTCIARKAIALLKTNYKDKNIFTLGIGLGGCTAYKLCTFEDGLTACATMLNILPTVEGVGNKIINYRAALDNAAYAQLCKVPMFISVASNDEDGSFYDMAELAQSTESIKCFRIIERGFSNCITAAFDQVDKYFTDCANGTADYPTPVISVSNSENNLYLNTVIKHGADSDNENHFSVKMFVSFCNHDPRFCNWMDNIPIIKLSDSEYMARINVVDNTFTVNAFVNVTDGNNNVLSSQLLSFLPKSLNIPSHPGVFHRRIYDSGMGKDCWSSPNGGSIEIKSGPYGLDGITSDSHSLATFKPNDKLFKTDPETLLQIIASGKPQDITVKVHDENTVYASTVRIGNADDWHKFTLSHFDFKGQNGPLVNWSDIVMLELTSDEEFIVSSVLWV